MIKTPPKPPAINFSTALFNDPFTIKDIYDGKDSRFEDRYYAVGFVGTDVVKLCYTYRIGDIRPISARKLKGRESVAVLVNCRHATNMKMEENKKWKNRDFGNM